VDPFLSSEFLLMGASDVWILVEGEVEVPARNEEHRETVNELECSESLCVGLNLRGSEKATTL